MDTSGYQYSAIAVQNPDQCPNYLIAITVKTKIPWSPYQTVVASCQLLPQQRHGLLSWQERVFYCTRLKVVSAINTVYGQLTIVFQALHFVQYHYITSTIWSYHTLVLDFTIKRTPNAKKNIIPGKIGRMYVHYTYKKFNLLGTFLRFLFHN